MNTTENNKLIAEFMNCENPQAWEDDLYNNDWNWLMEVVEKIEGLEDSLKNETREQFNSRRIELFHY